MLSNLALLSELSSRCFKSVKKCFFLFICWYLAYSALSTFQIRVWRYGGTESTAVYHAWRAISLSLRWDSGALRAPYHQRQADPSERGPGHAVLVPAPPPRLPHPQGTTRVRLPFPPPCTGKPPEHPPYTSKEVMCW